MPTVTLTSRLALYGGVVTVCVALAALQTVAMADLGWQAGVGLAVAIAVGVAVMRQPLLGVQLAFLAVPLEVFSINAGAAGLTAAELLLLLTAFSAVVKWAIEGRVPPIPGALRAVALLCLVIALGYTVAQNTVIVTKVLLMWSAFTVVALLVSDASPRDLWRILACLAIAGGIVGGIAASSGGPQSLVAGGEIATNRAQGSFEQPNVLGFFLVMSIPPGIILASRGSKAARVAMLLLTALALWGLMLSLSRTSLVGTILGAGILLLWPAFRRVALLVLAGLLIFSLLNFKALQQSQQVTVVSGRLGTLAHASTVREDPRLEIYRTAPKIFLAHPLLGVGEGNFSLASMPYGLRDQDGLPYDHAHNVALTMAAELGVPGLIALGWLAVAVAGLGLQAIRNRDDPVTGPLGLALAAAMIGVLMTNLGDYPPRTNVIAAAFLVEVGALAALARRSRDGEA